MCPPNPEHPSLLPRLSQSTCFGCPSSYIKLPLAIYFTYGNVSVSMLFFQIIPPSPSPTESKSLFFTSVSRLLPVRRIQVALVVKNLPAKAGDARDTGLIPGLGRSPGVGNGNLLQLFLPRKFHQQKRPRRL